jgi:hypothetical protein
MAEAKLEERNARRIRRKRIDVFLRKDFEDEGGYDQVGRALRSLVRKGELIPMGKGLYGRAVRSPFDGKPVLAKGIKTMTEAALRRLGVKTYPSAMTRAYNEGRTTQVPSGRIIGVDKRVRRKIGVDGIFVQFERARAKQG